LNLFGGMGISAEATYSTSEFVSPASYSEGSFTGTSKTNINIIKKHKHEQTT